MRLPLFLLLLVAAGLRAGPDQTALLPEPDELAAYQREAAAAHPGLRAANLAADAASAGAPAESILPDPSFSLDYENDGWNPTLGMEPMSVARLGVSQPIPVAGTRALRRKGADAGADAARAGSGRAALALHAAVARAYWTRSALRERLAVVDDQARTLALIEVSARARYGAGQGSQTEVLSAQAAQTALRERRARLVAEDEAAGARFSALLARVDGTPPVVSATLPTSFAEPDEAALAERARNVPEFAGLAAERAGADARAELARRERRPEFGLTGGLGWRGSLDPMWMAGVTIRLPRPGRTGPNLSRARLEAESAGARADALRFALRARIGALRARLRGENESLRLQRNGVLPQRELAVKAALADYTAGRIPFTLALGAVLDESAAREDWIENRLAAAFTLIDLESLDPAAEDAAPMTAAPPARSSANSTPAAPGGM